jgi:hypothetical protein
MTWDEKNIVSDFILPLLGIEKNSLDCITKTLSIQWKETQMSIVFSRKIRLCDAITVVPSWISLFTVTSLAMTLDSHAT